MPVLSAIPDWALCMKVYNLSCDYGHCFEGWFSSEDDYVLQLAENRIECPVCDSRAIKKLPSAPRLNLPSESQRQAKIGAELQKQLMAMLRHVAANTEDVGDRFAEEARRIHYKEIPERAIRGVATIAEYEALEDEGIEVTPLPIPAALKRTLQ